MSGPRGQHVCLDYLGWQWPDEEGVDGAAWMLEVLRKGVRLAGAREVHAHVATFDGPVSPDGLAAVVVVQPGGAKPFIRSEVGQDLRRDPRPERAHYAGGLPVILGDEKLIVAPRQGA